MFAYMKYFTVDNYARVARSLTRARRSVLVGARLQGYLHDCRSRQTMCTPLLLLLRSRSSTVILLQPHQPSTKKTNFQITLLKKTLQTTIKLHLTIKQQGTHPWFTVLKSEHI